MRNAREYTEAGVRYSHANEQDSTPVEIVFSPDFKQYTTQWESPTGVKGESTIYTTSRDDMRRLVHHWNRQDWRYIFNDVPKRTAKCFVCGGEIDLYKPHMGSNGNTRHMADNCGGPAPQHVLESVGNMAYNMGLMKKRLPEGTALWRVLNEAENGIREQFRKLLDLS